MISTFHPRLRIALVLVGAFAISGLLMKYSTSNDTAPPQIQIETIVSDFTQSINDSKNSLLASIQSVRIPSFHQDEPAQDEPTPLPTEAQIEPTQEWDIVPTGIPSSTPAILPTTTHNQPPTTSPLYPTVPRPQPTTYKPQPTKAPTPTKIPKPTAIPAPPPITSDVRPGTSIEEILREVSKRACIPYALLMATRTEESGSWMNGMSAATTKFYNTYGWWKSAGKGEICYALGYYTQSGLIPADSGGGSCNEGVQPGAYDQKIMGLMQMSEQEEQVTRKYTSPSLPKSIDRRVLFDNALIYAFATKNRLGTVPKSCDDWPEDAVKAVAEKHFGACGYPGGNYCNEIWALYKKFR
jgi:hypothetical protein